MCTLLRGIQDLQIGWTSICNWGSCLLLLNLRERSCEIRIKRLMQMRALKLTLLILVFLLQPASCKKKLRYKDRSASAQDARITGGEGTTDSEKNSRFDKRHVPMSRLLVPEFINTVKGAFPSHNFENLHQILEDDFFSQGYRRGSEVSIKHVEKFTEAAEFIAIQVGGTGEYGCNTSEVGCLEKIIRDIGHLLWRRPLDDLEVTNIADSDVTKNLESPQQKLAHGIFQLLVSPFFLMHWENLRAYDSDPAAIAHRLSYLILGMPATPQLVDKIKQGEPVCGFIFAEGRPFLLKKLQRFYLQWLGLEYYQAELTKTETNGIEFSTQVKEDLFQSAMKTLVEDFYDGTLNFKQLFTQKKFYIKSSIAPFFNLEQSAVGVDFSLVNAQYHIGIFSHPLFMATAADTSRTNIVSRGLLFLRKIIGLKIEDPPENFDFPDQEPGTGVTARQILTQLTSPPDCMSCHQNINPPGFASEIYDHYGRYRQSEAGVSINQSGEIIDAQLQFTSFSEMVKKLAELESVKDNFLTEIFRFYQTTNPTDEELAELRVVFEVNDYHLKPVLHSILCQGAL